VFVTSAPAPTRDGTLFAAMFQPAGAARAAAFWCSTSIAAGLHRGVTDQVQFVLMYAGFVVVLAFLVARHGGLGFLEQHTASHFTWHGGNPPAG
jgi:hypothetical protein